MRKYFVLSTRPTVSKRNITQSFGSDNTIVIPMAVVDEVQASYAHKHDERGKIARDFLEYLWSFNRKELFGDGVIQENGSILMVTNDYHNEQITEEKVTKTQLTLLQTQVLKACLNIKKRYADPNGEKVVLVSKNTALRMKAEFLGINAQTYRDELLPEFADQYTGRAELEADAETINELYKGGNISIDKVKELNPNVEFYPNMFVSMTCGRQASAIGRVEGNTIVPLVYERAQPYGVWPKNAGQRFMMEALMMDAERAPLVIIKGPAGTGKTYLPLAAGLDLAIEKHKYPNKILCSRSVTETGERIGFLPGTEGEKMDPFMRGIKDNLKQLINGNQSDSKKGDSNDYSKKNNNHYRHENDDEKPTYEDGTSFFERGEIQIEAISYIRGRTICGTFIIIDEVQNLTPTEVKTLITRVGTGTKLILMGDPAQIDRSYLDETNNGLSYACEHMKGDPLCWQVTMKEEESVRSELAKRASMLL